MKKDRFISLALLMLIFISGLTALIYQIIWIRKFSLIFGVHAFSTSTVLAVFMAGLAFGSFLFGRFVDKIRHPLRLFIVLEIGIALFAFAFPFLFDQLTGLYNHLIPRVSTGIDSVQLLRFTLSFFFLLMPTTLMGGTLPVLSKFYVTRLSFLGNRISKLYSANNLGSVLGAFLAGFILIVIIGLKNSLYFAAALNILNAFFALFLLLKTKKIDFSSWKHALKEKEPSPKKSYSAFQVKIALWIFGIEGFTTLAYEVIWTRVLLDFSFDKTVYFYSIIILSFIFGLALGSFLFRRKADKIKKHFFVLGWLEIAIGLSSFALFFVFLKLSPIITQLRPDSGNWYLITGREYLFIFILLLIPATLMGVTFPLVSKIYTDNIHKIGHSIGKMGFLDTVGSILGSFAGGFLLIPFLGIYNSFLLIVLINISIGLLALIFRPQKKQTISILTALFFFVAFGVFYFLFPSQKIYQSRLSMYDEEKVLSYREGVSATVSVHQLPAGGKALAINGAKTAFTNVSDLKVHHMLAYLPWFYNPQSDTALVIGFGMGVTANTLTKGGLKQVYVAEISPEVVNTASREFAYLNQQVVHNPKVKIIPEDGRSYLFRSTEKFDVITSNAVHARLGANLYTRDFYELCYQKISDKGIVCQWLPTNWLSTTEFKSLIKAITDVFPHTSLWYVTRGHTLLLGSKQNLNIDYNSFSNLYRQYFIQQDLTNVEIMNTNMFIAHLLMNNSTLAAYAKGAPDNTDNFPFVEFSKEVDLKPNPDVIKELQKKSPDFAKLINFNDQDSLSVQQNLKQITSYHQQYLKNLELYLESYKNKNLQ